MDKILLFGGNGFVGRHLINFFYKKKYNESYELYVIGSKKNTNKIKNYVQISSKDQETLDKLIAEVRPEYIVNLIGFYGEESFTKSLELNFMISSRIIDSIVKNKIDLKKILLIGSASEYGEVGNNSVIEDDVLRPLNIYGLSKKFQTELAIYAFKKYGLKINIARIFNLLGEGISESLAPGRFLKIISEAKNGSSINVGNLSSVRDYIQIQEAATQLWKILIDGVPGEIYNVCSGKGTKMVDLLNQIIDESKKSIQINIDSSLFSGGGVSTIIGNNEKFKKLYSSK